MSLLFLLFIAVILGSSDAVEVEHLCYGKNFYLPSNYTPAFFGGQLLFTPSNGGSQKLLMKDGEAVDQRLNVSYNSVGLIDLSERDNGTFSISDGDSTKDIVTLIIDDCAEKMTKNYMDFFGIALGPSAGFVEFSPTENLDQTHVLWNHSDPEKSNVEHIISTIYIWKKLRVTQQDNGFYNVRNKDRTLLHRVLLTVNGFYKRVEAYIGEHLFIQYPAAGVTWTLIYTPEQQSKSYVVIHKDQLVTENGYFKKRVSFLYNGIEIVIQSGDSGIFKLTDQMGDVAVTVKLKVEEGPKDDTYMYVAPGLAVIAVLIIACCLVKKFCFKERVVDSNELVSHSTAATDAASPAVHYHPVTKCSSDEQPTAFTEPQVPVQGDGDASTSLLLTSAPEPQFDLNGLNTSSPLNSEPTFTDVYNTDQLNFLD